MIYILDDNDFLIGIVQEMSDSITQKTTTIELKENFIKARIINNLWHEGATEEELNKYIFKELIIYPLIKQNVNSFEEIAQIDFTLIGLTTETPKYGTKGIKSFSDYTLNGKLAVRKEFVYTDLGLEITFKYYLENGEIRFEKTEFKPLDVVELAKIFIGNRARTIAYLQASAVGTPIENYVNALLKRYFTEVGLFVQNNTKDFENVVKNENVAPFINYLNIDLRGGIAPIFTVKDSILKQIS